MGGLAGGLFAIFEGIGYLFFFVLIGPNRAGRSKLQNQRVAVGGILFGALVGWGLWWWWLKHDIELLGSAALGAVGGFLLSLVLISYVESLESERREEKRRKELIDKGVDPDKACFIATAVFGSAHEPEVNQLRMWRDRCLRPHLTGRMMVEAYYWFSPRLSAVIAQSSVLKAAFRFLLSLLLTVLRRAGTI